MRDVLHCFFFVYTGYTWCRYRCPADSPDGSALHLVFMSSSSTLQGQYIVGDGCIINIKAHCSTAYGSLAVLVAYYVFDANYPAQYAMLLAILQIFVMQEPNTRQTCQKFELFVKKLRSLFDCIFVSD